ncbi:MAG TPA: hypothetical protein VIV14_00430, partial [Gammaproteobacteria bacterium]
MSATDDNRERRRTAAEGVRRIVMRLVRVHRRQSLRTLMLSLLAAATEGIGILVLIPLLSLLGMATQAGGAWLELPFVEAVSGNLVVVVAVFLGLLSLRQLSVYFQRLDVMRTRLDFSKELRLDLLAALAGAKWERFSAGTLHRQVQILTLD